jgi:hypothetical protein
VRSDVGDEQEVADRDELLRAPFGVFGCAAPGAEEPDDDRSSNDFDE